MLLRSVDCVSGLLAHIRATVPCTGTERAPCELRMISGVGDEGVDSIAYAVGHIIISLQPVERLVDHIVRSGVGECVHDIESQRPPLG